MSTYKRRARVPRIVRSTVGAGRFASFLTETQKMGAAAVARKREQATLRRSQASEGLFREFQKALEELSGPSQSNTQGKNPQPMDVDSGFDLGMGDNGSKDNDVPYEDQTEVAEGITVDIRDADQLCRWHGRRKYKDGRTWRNRIHNLNAAWASLMDELADAYVKWKYKKDLPDTFDENFSFNIDVVNLLTLEKEAAIQRDEHTKAAVALVYAGYIGTSPEIPSLAISLQTLDTYYTLRLSNPSFSFETFAKIVCDSYSIPYRRGYRTGLSNAFDVYLAIRRKIDIRART